MQRGLSGYEIGDQIYASRRSSVSLARRLDDGTTVMLKRSAGEMLATEALTRYRHEFEVLRAVACSGVVRAYEVGRDGNAALLVLEDFGGRALRAHLDERRFDAAEALDIAVQLASALDVVHRAGVVHKDVNPSNVVYNRDSRVAKLIDFDISTRMRLESHGFTAPGALEGTLLYMAPEQTGRMNRSVDVRSDLYSLGMTLYELFTGELPFRSTDPLEIVHCHLAVEPVPPRELDASLPPAISDMISKLLSKAPEMRYQTAAGLAVDLRECARQLATSGCVGEIPLASSDVSDRFELPERLYGRDAEVLLLCDAFDRAAAGGVETVFVAGSSGIGKTAVVRAIYEPVTRRRGFFVSGKFDQLRRDVPCSAVLLALGDLVEQLLTESEASLAEWRRRIEAAIHPNGGVLAEVIPAIDLVIGPQPPVMALDPAAAQKRFTWTLQRFVQVFARTAHPLVMFLDDMQWADSASLNVLAHLAASEETEALLLVEAYRDSEISPMHPFRLAIEEHAKKSRTFTVSLGALSPSDTARLVADALHRDVGSLGQLGTAIWQKTEGNPFFVRQFLRTLHGDGHIRFDPTTAAFELDLGSVASAAITDNVADLLAYNLRKLPPQTQRIVTLAAAIGNRFDVGTLSVVSGASEVAVHDAIAPALERGLVVPISSREVVHDGGEARLVYRRLAFQHDRIQRAAYDALPASERPRVHLELGRLLLAALDPSGADEHLFDVVGHLNRGIDEMPDPSERAKLAELNVRAGEKARNSAAYDVATASFRTALLLRGFDEDHELAYGASSKLAESYYLSADPEKALEVIDRTITHTRSVHERGELEALRVTVHLTAGDMLAAVACGREAARLVGIDLPSDPAELGRAVEREIGIVLGWLASGPIERLFDLPPMQDPQKIVSMTILMNCIPPAYQTDTTLMALLCAKTVTLSLEHGNCATSARGYCSFAILLHAMGQDDAAYVFAKAGVELNRRRGEPALESAVQFLFGTFVSPWKRPIEESLECLRAGFARGLETGDYPHMAYSASVGIAYALTKGAPLAELESSAESFRKLCEELGENVNAKMLAWNLEFIRDLRGTDPRHPTSAERKEADERTLATLRAARNNSQEFHFQAQRLERCYLFGDYAAAVAIAAESEPLRPTATGFLTTTHHHYYSGLALLAGEPAMERSALESKLDACERELARRRDGCPENFGAMYLLFAAERARSSGDAHQATDLYDRAIAEASEHGLLNHEALANERAGRFWLSRKKPEFAAIYVRRAMALYVLWGADAKARMLENEHRELVVFAAPVRAQTTHTVGATTARDALDLATVVKAGRAISGEIVLDRLLGVMTDIIVENAGARMGAVVLEEDGAWLVQAARDQTSGETSVMKGELLSETEKISAGVVNYVLRTGESVVVDDARVHGVFASDPYVRSKKPKSVLCTPIRHKSRVMGALYLENGLVAGAFTAARLEALEILASQLAVSIENARLFAREKEQADAIAKVNDHLEELVAERTKELSDANRKLRDESAARERAEVELRLAQKLQSVGQLAAGVAHEINTPMQFVGDNLEFVREAFEDLIELVDAYRAARPHISDEQIAGALLRAEEDADLEYLRVHVAGATDRALEGVRRVSGIVRAMKAFSHPDRTEKTAVDVNAAIENTLVVAHNEYKLVADVVTELGAIPTVLGHGGELSQVLLNLVVNAAHAIEDVVRGTENKGTIRVASRLEDDAILVTVSDSGGGIPESIRERIFDPFFTTKDVGRGTGQGLAIARSAVERHGGRIWFESETGRGTTFVLRLPLDAETATRAA